jgi:HK97 family phage portal protein
MSFRETYAAHLLSWGNGYAEIERTGGRVNKIMGLWPITPNRVTVKRNQSGRIEYQISMEGVGAPVALDKSKILHTPGLSYNGLVGYSPVGAAREAIGLGLALEEFGGLYFGQGTHPGVIVSHPTTLSPSAHANMTASLAESHSGLGKSHRLMLLQEGMRIEKIGIPNDEAQFLESRKYTNVEIGTRIFRLFPQQYGEYDKASTYASAEQFAIDYVTKVLRSWLVRLEQSYNMALLDPSERGIYFFEHNIEGMLRGDIASRYTAYQIARRNGAMNADEWREIENMNPIKDGLGQKYVVEANMIDLADLGKELNQIPASGPPDLGGVAV